MVEGSEDKPIELALTGDENQDLNQEYQLLVIDYDTTCAKIGKLAKDLKTDFQNCTDRMEKTSQLLANVKENNVLDYDKVSFFAKLPVIKRFTCYNNPSLPRIIEEELQVLVSERTKLKGKISIAKREREKGSRKIESLFNLEKKILNRMIKAEKYKARAQAQETKFDAEHKELNAEYEKGPQTSKQRKRLLSLDKKLRALRVKISDYDTIIYAADSSIKQVKNLRDAYELLADKGMASSLKGANILEGELKNSHLALERMVHGKIALGSLVQTAYEAAMKFIVIREDMNYFLEKLIYAAAKLPETIKVCDQPFYREQLLSESRKQLEEGEKAYNKEDDDVINVTPE